MKKLLILAFVAAAGWFGIRQLLPSGAPDLTISGDEVLLATGDLDVRFTKGEDFDDTFMVFGGAHVDHRNAIANVTLAGLSVRHAKPIYRQHPDFDRCASPGAALAESKVVQLDMVPVDGDVLETLESSLEDFSDSLRSGGDRVCLHLSGSRLQLASAEVREVGEEISDRFDRAEFYLVDSVRRVECAQVLREA